MNESQEILILAVTTAWERVGVNMPRGHLGVLVVLEHPVAEHVAAELVFSRSSGALRCLAAAVASTPWLHFQSHHQWGC